MAEYIDREVLFDALGKLPSVCGCAALDEEAVWDAVRAMPAADVVEVRHGEWVNDGDGDWRCYSCRRLFTFDDYGDVHPIDDCWFNYCPNCGCRMDKDGE